MATRLNLLLLFFGVVYCVSGLQLPANFQKCRRSDPKLNECLRSAIEKSLPLLAKGLPEFKFEGIEPVKVPSLTVGEGEGAVHVVQHYTNVEIHNLQYAKFRKVESTVTDKAFKLIADIEIKESDMTAQYSLNGNILVLPIVGEGNCTLKLRNITAKLTLIGEIVEKKAKKYLRINTFTIALNPEIVEYNFENLFNGDPVLGTQMNAVLNDNWKDVFDDVKPGYEEALGAIFKGISNIIMKNIPYDELFPL